MPKGRKSRRKDKEVSLMEKATVEYRKMIGSPKKLGRKNRQELRHSEPCLSSNRGLVANDGHDNVVGVGTVGQ